MRPRTTLDQSKAVHRFALRIWYEDTDQAGIVYHANYLKFIERARSDWVAGRGVDQTAMRLEDRTVFAVRQMDADWLRPAVFGDALVVETRLAALGGVRIVLDQCVLRDATALFRAEVELVCMTREGRPLRVPERVRMALTDPW